MRNLSLAILAISCVASGFTVFPAEAKTSRNTVSIAPRYLTAGPLASPYEYRGVVPETDARFLPVTYGLNTGRFTDWGRDPWLVPYKRSGLSLDFDGWSGKRHYNRY